MLIQNQAGNSRVEGNNIFQNFGEGILVSDANLSLILLNTVEENGLDGIYLQQVSDTNLISNTVNANERNGMLLSASANNLLDGNTIRNNGSLPPDATKGQGVYLLASSKNNTVSDNLIVQNLGDGVRLSNGSGDNDIDRNQLEQNKTHGIQIASSDGNTVSQNTILESDVNGIYLYNVDGNGSPKGCLITSNIVSMSGKNGIELDETRYCIIDFNTADSNGDDVTSAAALNADGNAQNGISLHTASHHNQVRNNTTHHNAASGIRIAGADSDFNVLEANESHRNVLHGLMIVASASDNRAEGNTVYFNKADGAHVEGPETLRNQLISNAIYINDGLAIETITGGNLELTPPVVNAMNEITTSVWDLTGTTCANCTVEAFSDFGHEAQFVEGSTTADGAGKFVISGIGRTGYYFALTTRTPEGNTSELSIVDDMYITDVEVTQAVQSVDPDPLNDNLVRLTAGKPTVVRVHVRSTVGPMPVVTARLYGHHGPVELGMLTPNDSFCPAQIEVQPQPDRAVLEHAFCFVLPQEWIEEGDLDLSALVNPNIFAPETNYTNNNFSLPAPAEFKAPPKQPRLRFYRVSHRMSLVRGMAVEKGYAEEDDIDIGDIDGDGQNDIVVASASVGHVAIYTTTNITLLTNSLITVPLTIPSIPFEDGYDMAVGNVDDDDAIEVVIANNNRKDDTDVQVYEWDGVTLSFEDQFFGDFTNNDALAIGDLLPDPEGRNEIAIAGNVTGRIDIYRFNGSTWTHIFDFKSTYDGSNQFAVGNVLAGNGQDEIIISRNVLNEIDVYQFDGSLVQI